MFEIPAKVTTAADEELTVTDIGKSAFSSKTAITSLILPSTLKTIGEYAFRSCTGLTGTLSIPGALENIKVSAFLDTRLTAIDFSNASNLKQIDYNVFGGNNGYRGDLILPEGIETANGFYGCGFDGTLKIPATLTQIYVDKNPFSKIINESGYIQTSSNDILGDVQEIYCYQKDGEICDTIGKGTYIRAYREGVGEQSNFIYRLLESDEAAILGYTGEAEGDLVIPDVITVAEKNYTVTSIGQAAFKGMSGFTGTLTIPDTVREIGEYAFHECTGLNGDIELPSSLQIIGNYAFTGCTGFNGILTMKNQLTSIGDSDFTVISNQIIRDPKLDGMAKGTLITMLSLPDGWSFSIKGLCAIQPLDGKAKMGSAIKRIEEAGYLYRKQKYDSSGRFMGMDYVLTDEPAINKEKSSQILDTKTKIDTFFVETAQDEDNEIVQFPQTDFRLPENPSTENRFTYKIKTNKEPTNKISINQSIAAPLSPEGEMERLMDGLMEEKNAVDYIKSKIEYDILVHDEPAQVDIINEIVSLMAEVVTSTSNTLRVCGENKPAEVVKSQILKNNNSTIRYVLSSLNNNTSEVKNIKLYIITALYNAPSTINNYYKSMVQHDLFSGDS